jgi:hypothetical protein
VLAARRQVIADLLARARQPNFVRALGDAEAVRRLVVGQLDHVADDERGALARRQAVDDRRHAALLELPQQEVALRIAERSHHIRARRLAAQRLVERVEVDLGLARQALFEHAVGEPDQPREPSGGVGRASRELVRGEREDVDEVTLRAIAIEREPEHEVVERPPVRLDEPPGLIAIQLARHWT